MDRNGPVWELFFRLGEMKNSSFLGKKKVKAKPRPGEGDSSEKSSTSGEAL